MKAIPMPRRFHVALIANLLSLVAVGQALCLGFSARTRPRYTACRSGEMACPGRRVRKETPSSSEGACCRGKAGAFSVVSKADVTSSGYSNRAAEPYPGGRELAGQASPHRTAGSKLLKPH